MNIYIDINKRVFTNIEKAKPFYQGNNSTDKICLYFNQEPSNWSPTIIYLLPNGRRLGPLSPVGLLYFEDRKVNIDGVDYYCFEFMVNEKLGILSAPGKVQATVLVNYYNENGNTIQRAIIGNVVIPVIKTACNENKIIVAGDNLESIVMDFGERIETLDNRVTNVETGVRNAMENNLDVPIELNDITNVCV